MSYSSCKTLKKLKKIQQKIAKYENEITSANAIKKSSRRLAINWLVDLTPPYVRFRIRRFNLLSIVAHKVGINLSAPIL